jgi:diguanylate cyclase (GGDEF)-like protein
MSEPIHPATDAVVDWPRALAALAAELATDVADPRRVAERIAEGLGRLGGDAMVVWLLGADGGLVPEACWHRRPDRRALLEKVLADSRSEDHRPLMSTQLGRHVGWDDLRWRMPEVYRPWFEVAGLRSVVVEPLRVRGRLLGSFACLREEQTEPFTADDVAGLEAGARAAAFAMDNALMLAEVAERESFATAMLDALPLAAAVIDDQGAVLRANAAWSAHPQGHATRVPEALVEGVRQVLARHRSLHPVDHCWEDEDGSVRWSSVQVSPVAGHPRHALVTQLDITERVEQHHELAHRATHDALTGLPNRVLLEDRLESALARARRGGRRIALAFLDLDGFKEVNDALGHAQGDRVLAAVARALSGAVRSTDTVARHGGDEFVVLLEAVEPDDAARVADELRAAAAGVRAGDRPQSVSIGMVFCDGSEDADTLLSRADAAMYRAKASGDGQVVVWSEALPSR